MDPVAAKCWASFAFWLYRILVARLQDGDLLVKGQ